jgi:hypothetical protein
VEGFVPSFVLLEVTWDGFGLYVTGLEDDAVADGGEGRYDIVMRSKDEDKKYYIYVSLKSRGTDSYVNNL